MRHFIREERFEGLKTATAEQNLGRGWPISECEALETREIGDGIDKKVGYKGAFI